MVLRTVPGDAAPKLALGLCGELLGRNEEAARRYGTVWQTDRSYVSAAFGLARAKLALGDPAEAISALREVPVNSRYASSALLAALVAAGREGGKLAPELFEIAGRDETIGKMKVLAVLESMPGLGKVKARRLMEEIGISETRRIRGLGSEQRKTLLKSFVGSDSPT